VFGLWYHQCLRRQPLARTMINVNQHRRTLHRTTRITTNTEIQHMHLCSHRSAINTDQWSQIRRRSYSKRDKYDQSRLLRRPLPDLSAKEYQLLYKREYLEYQPLLNGPWFEEYKLCIPSVIQRINPFKKALDSRLSRILLPPLSSSEFATTLFTTTLLQTTLLFKPFFTYTLR
jgi:hypothetical protein